MLSTSTPTGLNVPSFCPQFWKRIQWDNPVLSSLPGFTGFYWILPGFDRFYWVLPCFTGFYWVLVDFSSFCWVLPDFAGFCRCSTSWPSSYGHRWGSFVLVVVAERPYWSAAGRRWVAGRLLRHVTVASFSFFFPLLYIFSRRLFFIIRRFFFPWNAFFCCRYASRSVLLLTRLVVFLVCRSIATSSSRTTSLTSAPT